MNYTSEDYLAAKLKGELQYPMIGLRSSGEILDLRKGFTWDICMTIDYGKNETSWSGIARRQQHETFEEWKARMERSK